LTIAEKANQTIEEEKKSPTIQYSSIPKSLSEHAKQKNALQNMFSLKIQICKKLKYGKQSRIR
jgi:hypothetical protein